MARVAGGGMIVYDTIGPNLDRLAFGLSARVADVMLEGAIEMLSFAQSNAPWADRSGAARSGLDSDVSTVDGLVEISLFHTVEYGVWLELIQNGSFATILPTIEALGPGILNRAGAAVIS